MWINEGMTAFPGVRLKTVPGMDPVMQFQATETVPDGDLGLARVDVSVSAPDSLRAARRRGACGACWACGAHPCGTAAVCSG
jgi:hypothetical protein